MMCQGQLELNLDPIYLQKWHEMCQELIHIENEEDNKCVQQPNT